MRYGYGHIVGLTLIIAISLTWPMEVWAHGQIGKRFFPESLTLEDPFPADESNVTGSSLKEEDGTKDTTFRFEIQKRFTPDLSLVFESEHVWLDKPKGETNTHGFANPEFTLKYAFARNPAHEFIGTFGLSLEVGNIGAAQVESESNSSISPRFFFGKGMGDLPESLEWFRPLAFTGAFGLETPLGKREEAEDIETEFQYGILVQYNLQYLQSFVRDIGLPKALSQLVPITEFSFETAVNGPDGGKTTAFANPGLIWMGRTFQVSAEAQIPLNEHSGGSVGVIGQLHFYLDDMFPNFFTWTPFGTIGPTRGR